MREVRSESCRRWARVPARDQCDRSIINAVSCSIGKAEMMHVKQSSTRSVKFNSSLSDAKHKDDRKTVFDSDTLFQVYRNGDLGGTESNERERAPIVYQSNKRKTSLPLLFSVLRARYKKREREVETPAKRAMYNERKQSNK